MQGYLHYTARRHSARKAPFHLIVVGLVLLTLMFLLALDTKATPVARNDTFRITAEQKDILEIKTGQANHKPESLWSVSPQNPGHDPAPIRKLQAQRNTPGNDTLTSVEITILSLLLLLAVLFIAYFRVRRR